MEYRELAKKVFYGFVIIYLIVIFSAACGVIKGL